MVHKHVDLTGTLHGGIVGPGGETTGYVLALADLDVDMSGIKEPPHVAGWLVVAGELQTRTYPLRGRVTTLHATAVAASPARLSKAGQRASVILSGELEVGLLRPGSEGPPYSLTGANPEVDTAKITNQLILNKPVRVSGSFVAKQYVTLGKRFLFDATAIKAVEDHAVPAEPPVAPATPGRISATGTSDTLSYDEALHDAIAQLQKQAPKIADFLLDIRVDDVTAQVGGIAGFHRLHITVSAPIPNR